MNTPLQPGRTIRVMHNDSAITGRVVLLEPRRLDIALTAPYGLLFNRSTPNYFSPFLLGDGFLGPEGPAFAQEQLLKLHRAATYLAHQLPLVAQAMQQEDPRLPLFLTHMDGQLGTGPLQPATFREAVLQLERSQQADPLSGILLKWPEPLFTGLVALQAHVLLYHWIKNGPFELRAADFQQTRPPQHRSTTNP